MASIYKNIYLNELPRYINGKIKWDMCLNYECNFVYDDIKGKVKILDYDKPTEHLTISYNNDIYKMRTVSFKNCSFGIILGKQTKDFKIKLGENLKDNKRNLTITDMEHRKNKINHNVKWYKYKCNKCGYEGWTVEKSLLDGSGCACCCASPKVIVPGINDIATTHPWVIKYLANKDDACKYTIKSTACIKFICPDCGKIKEMPVHQFSRRLRLGCTCGDGFSYPEKVTYDLLKQLNVEFITQYSSKNSKWCDKYKYDFYLPEYNMIIETHGLQHYKNRTKFKTTYKEQLEIDKVKRELALSNNVECYVELDCRYSDIDYIRKSIMSSDLFKYFNFDNINWCNADKNGSKNIIKVICNFYEDNKENMSIKEMSKKFKVTPVTINTYLKKGNKFGWCKYEPISHKNIRVIETGEEFQSARECIRHYIKFKNIKFNSGSISLVCQGKVKSHKGFHFEYVEENKNAS